MLTVSCEPLSTFVEFTVIPVPNVTVGGKMLVKPLPKTFTSVVTLAGSADGLTEVMLPAASALDEGITKSSSAPSTTSEARRVTRSFMTQGPPDDAGSSGFSNDPRRNRYW